MAEAKENKEEKAPKQPAPHIAKEAHHSKWNEGRCQSIARRFDSEATWAAGHPSSYKAASHWGWLDACCKDMKNRGTIDLSAKRSAKAAKSKATPKKKTAARTKTTKTTKRKSA